MVRHQAIGINQKVGTVKGLGEQGKVFFIIGGVKEGLLALVPANNDMVKGARILKSWFSHSISLARWPTLSIVKPFPASLLIAIPCVTL